MTDPNVPNVPPDPYKEMEFEAFLKQIGTGSIGSWSILAEALGVTRHTINRWKQHPAAQIAISSGIEEALRMMKQTGKDDWKMWREHTKILGVKEKSTVEHEASDEVRDVLDRLDTDYAKLGQQAAGQVVAANAPVQDQGQAGAVSNVPAQPNTTPTPN